MYGAICREVHVQNGGGGGVILNSSHKDTIKYFEISIL